MAANPSDKLTSRRALANLLRSARQGLQDADVLISGRHPQNARLILQLVVRRLVEAVLVSERGWPLGSATPDIKQIPDTSPQKLLLARVIKLARPIDEPPLRLDGRLPDDPDRESLRADRSTIQQSLRQLTDRFEVDLQTDEPAGNLEGLTRTAGAASSQPTVQAGKKQVGGPRSGSKGRGPTAPRAAKSRENGRPRQESLPAPSESFRATILPPPSRRIISSSSFWALIDRWGVSDEVALQLIHKSDGLTKTGKRARFKLSDEQSVAVARYLEIDNAIASLGGDPVKWMEQPIKNVPFRGLTLLEYLRRNAPDGAKDVGRYLLKSGLKMSVSSRPAS